MELSGTNDLFSPYELGAVQLPNRLIMAPMTRNRADSGNIPSGIAVTYYEQRATAGLIITEGSQISPQGYGYPATPGIYSAEQIDGWKRVIQAVHARQGRIFLQLWHVGRISHPSLQPNNELPVAPSAIRPQGEAVTYEGMKPFVTPRALELAEIPGIVEQFRQGAQNALAAGFDGVEIHGANGYVIDQFLRDGSNHRQDAYGGTIENRARLLIEITDAVCSVWGPGRVGVRLAPLNAYNDMRDSNPEATFSFAVQQLNNFHLAYLHITEMGADRPGEAAGPKFDLLKLRRLYKGCYMTNGGYNKERAAAALAAGNADLISFGVLFLANPDLPRRFKENAPLNTPNPETFYVGGERGFIDYPALP